MQVAKTQERVNKIQASMSSMDQAKARMSKIDEMEAKANRMLDEANAVAELQMRDTSGDMDSLMKKYEDQPTMAVEDELAALKARLGRG